VSWAETFRTGLDAVRHHRLRSVLTMLGILIGIAAVILTVGLGQGAQDEVRAQIASLGSNLLIVSPGSTTSSSGVRGGFGSAQTLTTADARALSSRTVAPDIAGVAPVVSSGQTLTNGSTTWTVAVVGTTTAWPTVRARTVASGRFFTAKELASGAPVVVLGPDTASELGLRSAVGSQIDVGGTRMTVIGVLDSVGSSSSSSNEDDTAVVPETTATTRLTGGSSRTSVSTIYLAATSQSTLSAAYQEADAALLSLHGVTAADPDFTISSQQSLLATATSADRTLTVLLGGIAAISLLVGGIGVMNIMLVSVTERIREIGLRKALGATPRAVRRQFLVEASVLGLAGGVVGAVLGVVGAWALPHVIDQPVTLSPTALVGAVLVALAIGVSFGTYPASRAARLAPIDALRSE
jgi:putative ABC transport system permease protein